MKSTPVNFNVSTNWASGMYEVRARYQTTTDVYRANELIFEKVVEIGEISRPAFELDKDEAQDLMNALYQAGVRPTETFDQTSQIESIKYHLEDMRKLVFTKLKE